MVFRTRRNGVKLPWILHTTLMWLWAESCYKWQQIICVNRNILCIGIIFPAGVADRSRAGTAVQHRAVNEPLRSFTVSGEGPY